MKRTRMLLILLLLLGLSIAAVNAAGFTAAYYAGQGEKYKEQLQTGKAIECYEKTVNIDSSNAEYHAALAELYKRMADTSGKNEQMQQWREKSINAAETAVKCDSDYPYYNYILTQAYFDSGLSIKACEQAEKLVKLQPLKLQNYDFLARGYMEAGLQYIRNKNPAKAKELIIKCSEIDKLRNIKLNPTIYFYQGKALLLLGKFKQAEELIKKARTGSLSLKMDSDRLLYIINQETGRQAENKKYRNVIWMGMVEKTPDYIEIKQILSNSYFN